MRNSNATVNTTLAKPRKQPGHSRGMNDNILKRYIMKNAPYCLSCFLALTVLTYRSIASDQIPGAPQAQPIAITGATLHTISGKDIVGGTILFEDGRITQIGDAVDVPSTARVIQAEGKHVYPSLLEAYSDIGLVEINAVRATVDFREVGSNNANVQALNAFNPDSEIIPVNRSNGILLSVTAPKGGVIAGRSSLMMMDGWSVDDMAVQRDVAMHATWPRSSDATEQLNEIFEQADRYRRARLGTNSRQLRDLRLEALVPVLDGSMPLVLSADGYEEITAAIAFCKRHGVRPIIYGGSDAPRCAELLVREKVPVIVAAVYQSPRRRHAAYDEPYTLPERLRQAGIQYCISAGGRFGATGGRNLPYNAATAAAYGLPAQEALRAITLYPAQILNVHDRVGSLEIGRDATLFVADGDILETPTQVERAFVQGRVVDLDNKHRQLDRKYRRKYSQSGGKQ